MDESLTTEKSEDANARLKEDTQSPQQESRNGPQAERTAELAKANEALRRGLERLAESGDIEALIGMFLLEAMTAADAGGGVVMTRGAGGRFEARAVSENGALKEQGLQAFTQIIVEAATRDGARIAAMIATGKQHHILVESELMSQWPEIAAYHRVREHKMVWEFPFQTGTKIAGYVGLCFSHTEPLHDLARETVEALALQIALALELTRLAEEAKQKAVAEAQEKAAQERADELAKANQIIRRSADGLAVTQNVEDVLTIFLREAITASSAFKGAVLRRVSGTEFDFAAVIRGEVAQRGTAMQTYPLSQAMREESRKDETGYFARLAAGEPIWTRLPYDGKEWLADGVPYQQANNIQAIWDIPFSLNSEVVGFLGLAFQRSEAPTPVIVEIIKALASQIAVALELMRLAEIAKQAAQEAATLEERTRIARELHDTLAQSFTGIIMQLEAADFLLDSQPEKTRSCIKRARDLAKEGLAQARRSVFTLQPDSGQYSNLAASLTETVANVTQDTSVQARVTVEGLPFALPADIGRNLLRIAQEAVTNTLRHARSRNLYLTLIYSAHQIALRIEDDGRGFDAGGAAEGFGLRGMRERAERIGALLRVVSGAAQGTEITIVLPLTGQEALEKTP